MVEEPEPLEVESAAAVMVGVVEGVAVAEVEEGVVEAKGVEASASVEAKGVAEGVAVQVEVAPVRNTEDRTQGRTAA